jgi:hypothetical protein
MEAVQKVADHMNLKLCEGTQFSQVNSMAMALTVNTYTTDGNQSLCSATSMQVELDLGRAQEEYALGYTRELGGKLGMQQQQGILQETWGDSRWEEIVCGPRQGGCDLATPLTQHRTHQEQCQRDAQRTG